VPGPVAPAPEVIARNAWLETAVHAQVLLVATVNCVGPAVAATVIARLEIEKAQLPVGAVGLPGAALPPPHADTATNINAHTIPADKRIVPRKPWRGTRGTRVLRKVRSL
jgi:hypothetical protein